MPNCICFWFIILKEGKASSKPNAPFALTFNLQLTAIQACKLPKYFELPIVSDLTVSFNGKRHTRLAWAFELFFCH